jgi:GxxExxY protein
VSRKLAAIYPHAHLTETIIGCILRLDLIVARTVLVELKALPNIGRDHIAQTLNSVRATGLQVGLILNFGPTAQIKRLIFTRKHEAPDQR